MSILIESDSVSVVRQGKEILKDISISISERDFVTVIGPNGAGKSMLLKCLMGVYPPDSGSLQRRQDLRIGYVPQRFAPDHTMPITTKRFLALRKQVDQSMLDKIIMVADIERSLHKPLHELSSGELQRVLLTRALADKPELLVLDEPAQNLDITGQLAFYKLLGQIYADSGISILMVSHDLHMIMSSTKRVVCLFHHICCSGEPRIVTKSPEFISMFGNDMADMMSIYQHSHDHQHEGEAHG